MEGDLSEHVVIVKTAVDQNHLHDALLDLIEAVRAHRQPPV